MKKMEIEDKIIKQEELNKDSTIKENIKNPNDIKDEKNTEEDNKININNMNENKNIDIEMKNEEENNNKEKKDINLDTTEEDKIFLKMK